MIWAAGLEDVDGAVCIKRVEAYLDSGDKTLSDEDFQTKYKIVMGRLKKVNATVPLSVACTPT